MRLRCRSNSLLDSPSLQGHEPPRLHGGARSSEALAPLIGETAPDLFVPVLYDDELLGWVAGRAPPNPEDPIATW